MDGTASLPSAESEKSLLLCNFGSGDLKPIFGETVASCCLEDDFGAVDFRPGLDSPCCVAVMKEELQYRF